MAGSSDELEDPVQITSSRGRLELQVNELPLGLNAAAIEEANLNNPRGEGRARGAIE
jgi:hypothetical protein